ncbi:hypothetical protein [Variovorax sp. dw_308]|uniref:hypothetical protein n=1 Tax=Variovorax sp. dw_308 TaxID=2721546 RepID=UPI00210C21DC|nr:hypothetical protein [Variovorax sp. dw_308]
MEEELASPVIAEVQGSSMLDLSRQQRNLLLMRPIFQLELNKLRNGEDAESSPFAGLDTHYLAMSALDAMMEATTISMGSTSQELQDHLSTVAMRMKPLLTPEQSRRVANIVIDALDNKAAGYKEFSFEYFDAVSISTKQYRFRLVRWEPDSEDVYRYRPTEEGYLVYLGMLDLSPEDAQVLMEKMLDLLVQRGRFEAALEIAKRARKLSIEYRQLIRDRLYQAYRSPGSVNWSRDMNGRLDAARVHVRQRQAEDARMEESIQDALRASDEINTRQSLTQLLKTVGDAGLVRMQLAIDISTSSERFIEAQRSVFRARRPTGLPDLESQLLPQVMNLTATDLAEEGTHFLSAMYPPVMPKIYDLNSVLALLSEQRAEEVQMDREPGEIERHVPVPPQFLPEVVLEARDWITERLIAGHKRRFDDLLIHAMNDALPLPVRQCIALTLSRSFAPTDSEFANVNVSLTGAEFRCDVAQGANLEFTAA